MWAEHDCRYMARALELARRGLYGTHPNPRVGCVVVHQGRVVGEGWHARAGGPHAEVMALQQAGDQAAGSTLYVTLEPCCHFGRTPPCTQALVQAGVGRVVAAMLDPNPRVSGAGIRELQNTGIDVQHGLLENEARALNPGFIKRMQGNGPWVRLKLAMSLDGRTAMASGESQWITGTAARLDVQRLRARASALLTGVGTVLADDPSLTVRLSASELGMDEPVRQPLRVILDTQLSTPPSAQIFRGPGSVLFLTCTSDPGRHAPITAMGAEVAVVNSRDGRVDLRSALDILAEHEINEVHVECGATLAGAACDAGLVDEMILYTAPHLMGDSARGLVKLPGVGRMAERRTMQFVDIRFVGPDIRIQAKFTEPAKGD